MPRARLAGEFEGLGERCGMRAEGIVWLQTVSGEGGDMPMWRGFRARRPRPRRLHNISAYTLRKTC